VNDRFFPLSDIATIRRGYADPPSSLFRYKGEPAIGLAIGMKAGANLLEFGDALKAEMEKVVSSLPIGVGVHLVSNQPLIVEEAVGGFTRALFDAGRARRAMAASQRPTSEISSTLLARPSHSDRDARNAWVTCLRRRGCCMVRKSTASRPPIERSEICRAASLAAARLSSTANTSLSTPAPRPTASTSIVVIARVASIATSPPPGIGISRRPASAIAASTSLRAACSRKAATISLLLNFPQK
jgi:hypothetical protein